MLTASLAQAAELRDMRLWDGPEATRGVFDLSASAANKVFTLANPSRLVIDIADVGSKAGAQIVTQQEGTGVIKGVRAAVRSDHSLRVVFDLSAPVAARSSILEANQEHGYRLLLDLYSNKPVPEAATDSKPVAAPAADSPAAPEAAAEIVASTPAPAPAPAPDITPAPAPVLEPAVKPEAPALAAERVPTPAVTVAKALAAARKKSKVQQARAAPATSDKPALHLQDKPIVVAIDPGHGGEDPGARGKGGLLEKNVALALGRKLAKMINATPGMKAVLTRSGDYYVGLRERVETARKADADLFVSIHANAYKSRDMSGTAVYVLSPRGASNEHARWLAHQENSADMVGGIDIQDKDHELAAVLIDLSQNATMEASFDVGSRILGSMGKINSLQKRVVQQAGFVVLKAPDIPSVLVETAFITNAREEQMLRDPEAQDKMAHSIFDGVRGYFQSYRPQQVADQPTAEQTSAAEAQPQLVEVSFNKNESKQTK